MKLRPLICCCLCSYVLQATAGIPEPGLTLYGIVKNDLGGATIRVTEGTIVWTIAPAPPASGPTVHLTTVLTNINNQFSYVLDVPFESAVIGFTAISSNALSLNASPTEYDVSDVSVDGIPASIVPPATNTVSFSRAERGGYRRVDLVASLPFDDFDGDDLSDTFELTYFFDLTAGVPGEDSDLDGLTNLEEFLAGTDPTKKTSSLTFVDVEEVSDGDMRVTWTTVESRTYSVMRSSSLLDGFVPLATGLVGTPPLNIYLDETAEAGTQYFYRVQLE